MATKNLARTVIEGGRTTGYQVSVARHAASERAQGRAFLQRVMRDVEAADAYVDPRRTPVHVSFDDKLAPIYRYLDANCGRPWRKVREEMFGRFDIRTTPGRHIVFDHILPDVEGLRRWNPRYLVDARGMLRKVPRRRYVHTPWYFDERPVFRWLGKRRITRAGDRFMWWEPVKYTQLAVRGQIHVRWRAVGLLSEADEKYLRSIPEKVFERVLARQG